MATIPKLPRLFGYSAMSGLIMLSPHFSLAELTVSDSAERLHINNTPPQSIIPSLEYTASVLETVRTLLGNRSIIVNSGYRSAALNQAIRGSANSAHIQGLAVDFICPKFGSPWDICQRLASAKIPFDQLIYEYGRWVHLGLCMGKKPRGQILTIDKEGTRYGLHAIRL